MSARDQLERQARQWDVSIVDVRETQGSVLGFGERGDQQVVLKITKQRGDEWRSGDVLRAFDGDGTVRVYESEEGAVLLERLQPGNELVELVRRGEDEVATEVLAQVILEMTDHLPPSECPTVWHWGRGFDRYLQSNDHPIPKTTVDEARELFQTLADSQGRLMLLHGDLHHYNVLFDSKRGWVAIDPKGVVGELEYEVGAILRNPVETPELLTAATTIEHRLKGLVTSLEIDYQRTVEWSFAQAVLSAIWQIEDGESVTTENHALMLAGVLREMI